MTVFFFFFQAEDGIRDYKVTGVQTCALPICDFGLLGLGDFPWLWRVGLGRLFGMFFGLIRFCDFTFNSSFTRKQRVQFAQAFVDAELFKPLQFIGHLAIQLETVRDTTAECLRRSCLPASTKSPQEPVWRV